MSWGLYQFNFCLNSIPRNLIPPPCINVTLLNIFSGNFIYKISEPKVASC